MVTSFLLVSKVRLGLDLGHHMSGELGKVRINVWPLPVSWLVRLGFTFGHYLSPG